MSGFTGVASNSLIRSGGNRFSGLFVTLSSQNKDMTADNLSDDVLELNPDLTANKLDYVTDTTAQIGGPIRRDKMWFFTSFQYYPPEGIAAGYPPPGTAVGIGPSARKESSPRFIFKHRSSTSSSKSGSRSSTGSSDSRSKGPICSTTAP